MLDQTMMRIVYENSSVADWLSEILVLLQQVDLLNEENQQAIFAESKLLPLIYPVIAMLEKSKLLEQANFEELIKNIANIDLIYRILIDTRCVGLENQAAWTTIIEKADYIDRILDLLDDDTIFIEPNVYVIVKNAGYSDIVYDIIYSLHESKLLNQLNFSYFFESFYPIDDENKKCFADILYLLNEDGFLDQSMYTALVSNIEQVIVIADCIDELVNECYFWLMLNKPKYAFNISKVIVKAVRDNEMVLCEMSQFLIRRCPKDAMPLYNSMICMDAKGLQDTTYFSNMKARRWIAYIMKNRGYAEALVLVFDCLKNSDLYNSKNYDAMMRNAKHARKIYPALSVLEGNQKLTQRIFDKIVRKIDRKHPLTIAWEKGCKKPGSSAQSELADYCELRKNVRTLFAIKKSNTPTPAEEVFGIKELVTTIASYTTKAFDCPEGYEFPKNFTFPADYPTHDDFEHLAHEFYCKPKLTP